MTILFTPRKWVQTSVWTFVAVFSFTFPISSYAEPSTTLLITPNKFPSDPKTVGSSVSVLSAEDIDKLKVKTVAEALRVIPGVSIAQTGHRGGVTGVFLRGAGSDQLLVLVDGVRMNDSTTGGFDFADLGIDNVERIEVLRGPQGLLYGSEAMGGVIHVITKKPVDGAIAGASIEAGSYGTHRESVRGGYGSKKFSSSTELAWEQTDGRSAAAANRGNSERDGFSMFSLSSTHSLRPSEAWEISGGLNYLDSSSELDGFEFGTGAVDDLNYEQDRSRLILDAKVQAGIGKRISPSVKVSYLDEELQGDDADDELNRFDITNELLSVQSQIDIEVIEDALLTLGHTYEHRQGSNQGAFDEQRDVNALFAQQQFIVGLFHLSGGARYEHDSDFGDEVTYRATAAVPLEDSGTRIHSSFGTGFKAPSFNQLAFPNFGNPNLDPETSVGFDFGVEQVFNEVVSADVTIFYTEYDDLITFDSETFLAENIEEARAQGAELTLLLNPCEVFDVNMSYTYTDSENRDTNTVLARRARHVASVVLSIAPVDDFDSSLRFLLVQSRRDSDGAKMDNYATVNATLRYKLSEQIRAHLRLVNLFDEEYEEIPGYSTAGFSAFAGVDVTLF